MQFVTSQATCGLLHVTRVGGGDPLLFPHLTDWRRKRSHNSLVCPAADPLTLKLSSGQPRPYGRAYLLFPRYRRWIFFGVKWIFFFCGGIVQGVELPVNQNGFSRHRCPPSTGKGPAPFRRSPNIIIQRMLASKIV